MCDLYTRHHILMQETVPYFSWVWVRIVFLFPDVHSMQINIKTKLTLIWIYYCLGEIMQIIESKEHYLPLRIVPVIIYCTV